ncbi:MAG: hypothetical protein FJW14_04195 [Acidimicrobiia bacterium]|nr:hypothetical protein [Acidimicrobiia bacterium]
MRRPSIVASLVAGVLCVSAPAYAQADLSGIWQPRFHEDQPERLPGPELGDYLGLPITEGARKWAESWDPSRLTVPEHQCQVHISPYIYRGPMNVRIWEEKDPRTQEIVAIKQYISTYEQTRTIWMDGRPHPSPNTPHTWMGFSTGRWEGDMLTVTTTHIKQGWVRRNGLPQSDRTTMTERFIRTGNVMTHVTVVRDPVYLTEPLVKSQNFVLSLRELPQQNWLWVCLPVVEVADRPSEAQDVPAYFPGENPFLAETRKRRGLPEEALRGGAETMYPEFQQKLRGRR